MMLPMPVGDLEALLAKAVADRADPDLDQAVAESVQSRAHLRMGGTWLDSSIYYSLYWRQVKESDIAPYGNNARDTTLRRMFYLKGNNIVQGAAATMIQKLQATEWTLSGPQNLVEQYRNMLAMADLGNGWNQFLAKVIMDWLTQDNGMFWELIGPGPTDRDAFGNARRDYLGNPMIDSTAPLAELWGIAHLDSARCWRTGDYNYPVLYYDLNGAAHKLHRTRVIYEADMANPNERWRGRGFCALSRVVDICQTIINWSEFRNEMLDDLPPLAYALWSNVNKDHLLKQIAEHEAGRQSRDQFVYSPIMNIFGMAPDKEAKVQMEPIRKLWDGFNERDSFDLYIDIVAMCFGIDRQELAPLTRGNLGSGHQAEVLQMKARGKGVGTLLVTLERFINMVLPDAVQFKFELQDIQQDMQRAQVQQIQAATIVSLHQKPLGSNQIGAKHLLPSPQDSPDPEKPNSQVKAAGVDMTGQPVTPPAQDTGDEDMPLITRDEGRHLLMKIGLLDSEVVKPITGDIILNDTTETVVQKRYGQPVTVNQRGELLTRPSLNIKDVLAAQEFLAKLGVSV